MVNFIVVDSDKKQRKIISNMIIKCMMISQIDFKIKEFSDYNSSFISHINGNENGSIYILHDNLSNKTGVDIARYIRNSMNDWNSPIIIIADNDELYYETLNQKLLILDFITKSNLNEKVMFDNIDISLRILSAECMYRYKYRSVEYSISLNKINYIQRDGRRTKIVTKNNVYYQNITINEIKKLLPKYFVNSAKGTILNIKNISQIDWRNMLVYFKDKTSNYVVTISHKKELNNLYN